MGGLLWGKPDGAHRVAMQAGAGLALLAGTRRTLGG